LLAKRSVTAGTYVQNALAKSLDKQFELPTVLLFVELNITMALGVLMEQRDFVGVFVAQSCGCETAERDPAPRLRSFSVMPCSSADTA
jgi:hypothetical protein